MSCPSLNGFERNDHYGIYTGIYCDPSKYPYRHDDYFDSSYVGECLDGE